MEGRDFLAVAHHLRSQTDEASVRTRIGRAYYAAFLEARSYCEQHLGFVRTMSSREHHDIARLIRPVDRDMANMLKFLRGFRNAADYDLHLSSSTMGRDVVISEDFAADIISRLDKLAADQIAAQSIDIGSSETGSITPDSE